MNAFYWIKDKRIIGMSGERPHWGDKSCRELQKSNLVPYLFQGHHPHQFADAGHISVTESEQREQRVGL